MGQHYLLSARARTLSLAGVAQMTDSDVENEFIRIRWAETDGKPVCPHCNHGAVYTVRRSTGALRFRCKACRRDFSLTSDTLFSFHKLPLRTYLLAIAIFCNEVEGKSALALSRDLGVQYKTAFVLSHKLREAMAQDMEPAPQASMPSARLQRAKRGHHHHIRDTYLDHYAQESGFRENHRRDPNGSQVEQVLRLALGASASSGFCGYWQKPSCIPK